MIPSSTRNHFLYFNRYFHISYIIIYYYYFIYIGHLVLDIDKNYFHKNYF